MPSIAPISPFVDALFPQVFTPPIARALGLDLSEGKHTGVGMVGGSLYERNGVCGHCDEGECDERFHLLVWFLFITIKKWNRTP